MKKLFGFLTIAILLFSTCSSDKEKYDILPPMSETLEDDEARLVFIPTSEQTDITLNIEYEGATTLLVNWGDDDRLHPITHGDINHTYIELDKEYTISIRPINDESYLRSIDIAEPKVATKIKSIRFGKSSKFLFFDMHTSGNILERLDFSKNPQFFSNSVYSEINTLNFAFEDFSNFTNWLSFDISTSAPVVLDKMNTKYLAIYYLNYTKPNITLKNSNIVRVDIRHRSTTLETEKIDFSGSNIEFLDMIGIKMQDELDLSKMSSNKIIVLSNCNAKTLLVPESTEELEIIAFIKDYNYSNKLEEIDLRPCVNLRIARIWNSRDIKNIYYDITDKTEDLSFRNNDHLENFEYRKSSNSDLEKTTHIATSTQTEERPKVLSLRAK